MAITRATNLAGLGTVFDALTDGGGLSISGISTFTDLNTTNLTGTAVTFTNATITGDLTVQGTTTTLDTTVENVDLLEVGANSAGAAVTITQSGSGDFVHVGVAGSTFKIFNDGRVSISERLLVGTSTAPTSGTSDKLQIVDSTGGRVVLARNNTSVTAGQVIGQIAFYGNDDNSTGATYQAAASISVEADGGHANNSKPGRLMFFTTADSESSPTERVRITSDGYLCQTTTGSYTSFNYNNFLQGNNSAGLMMRASNGSYNQEILTIRADRSASSTFSFLDGYTGYNSDREFYIRGDGNAYIDGSWNGSGADYAEYFEWSDGNPDEEDRRGISVVLDGDKIRPAVDGEDPIGVISGNPSVVGDAAWNKWSGKYLRDDYGTYIQEDYEVINDEGETVVQQRRKLNPAYDPDQEYINREDRPEWDCVGLMGKLRIRKGQPTGSRWIKMRDISDSVEEWLVR